MDQPIISIRNITVTYGLFKALDEVTLSIPRGQIVGLVGHNGAGKSTLVNAVTGAIKPLSGEIVIDGKPMNYSHRWNPLHMARLGLRVIHQEPSLVGTLSVADNITFRTDSEKKCKKEREEIARTALAKVGSTIDPRLSVSSLDFADRQIVDIARSLYGPTKAILLDEPTAALGAEETHRLHTLLLDLAKQGKSIVYVSHRLRDILEICDRIVVLREGHIVMDQLNREITATSLSEAVCPSILQNIKPDESRKIAPANSVIKAFWQGHNYEFASGEITGLFGMAAGPQFDFVQHLYGLGITPAEVFINGSFCKITNPASAMKHGIAYVSSDREMESLFPLMSALSNVCMPWLNNFSIFGFLSKTRMSDAYAFIKNVLNISGPTMHERITSFSGGNKQKHVLARWLMNSNRLKFLLLCQPLQGVDIQARKDISKALREASDNGLIILVASSEIDEITSLADRAYVCHGSLWKEIPRSNEWESKLFEALLLGISRKES